MVKEKGKLTLLKKRQNNQQLIIILTAINFHFKTILIKQMFRIKFVISQESIKKVENPSKDNKSDIKNKRQLT